MPYLFGGLVVLNAITLGYYLFLQRPSTTQTLTAAQEPSTTQTLTAAQESITQPLEFTNSAKYIPPVIGTRE